MSKLLLSYTGEIEELIAKCAALPCDACSGFGWHEKGLELLRMSSEWWFSETIRKDLCGNTFLEAKFKTPSLPNVGISYFLSPAGSKLNLPLILYEIQHDLTGCGKTGIHYQFQFPHGDIGKNVPKGKFKTALNRLWNRAQIDVESLVASGTKSLSPNKVFAIWPELSAHALRYSNDIKELYLNRKGFGADE